MELPHTLCIKHCRASPLRTHQLSRKVRGGQLVTAAPYKLLVPSLLFLSLLVTIVEGSMMCTYHTHHRVAAIARRQLCARQCGHWTVLVAFVLCVPIVLHTIYSAECAYH